MKSKLKYVAMVLSLLGIISPIVKIQTTQVNIYLGLINIGLKPFLLLLLLAFLILHPLYIPNKFSNIISIVINSGLLIVNLILFYFINLKINNFKNGFGFNFISSISGLDIKIFWIGWSLIYLGIILSLIVSAYYFKKEKQENLEVIDN